MSERSIRRANERRTAKDRRREALRRRRTGLVTGAAIGAGALLAPAAHAANFTVTTTGDGPPQPCTAGECDTLRDAVTEANATPETDVITFASAVTGQIVLTEDQLRVYDGITIDGPGAGVLAISGDNDDNGTDDGDFRIFDFESGDVGSTVKELTLTEGGSSYGSDGSFNGGAVYLSQSSDVTLQDVVVSNSRTDDNGGGIAVDEFADLNLVRTRVTGNYSDGEGGGLHAIYFSDVEAVDSQFDGNRTDGADGAGISSGGRLTVRGTTISGNIDADEGGGIDHNAKYGELEIVDSKITDNKAAAGAGIRLRSKYDPEFDYGSQRTIERTTISGNQATYDGGGVYVEASASGDDITIASSTIAGNGAQGAGGGIKLGSGDDPVLGAFTLSNSTVSGNTADIGGGVTFGDPEDGGLYNGGANEIENSTIAGNTARTRAGGIYLADYSSYDPETEESTDVAPTIPMVSTIVADNGPDDLDREDGAEGGGFDLAFSLIENPGDAPLFQDENDHNIVGVDPQLGPLGDNGGPTATHVPAQTSPAIDQGDAPPRIETDQRGVQRTLDGAPPNPEGGDGTDIGSVEIDRIPAQDTPPPQQQQTTVQGPGVPTIIPRVKPRGIRVSVTPRKDSTAPFTFTTTGRILPPTGMTNREACGTLGTVSVQVKRKGVTISTRRARVRANCRFSSQVAFKYKQRFGSATRLKFTVRFTGNQRLSSITARSLFRRVPQ